MDAFVRELMRRSPWRRACEACDTCLMIDCWPAIWEQAGGVAMKIP